MDIPGIKQLRLIQQQPIALMPGGGMNATLSKSFFIEVTFENDAILNVPVSKLVYDAYLDRLREQGLAVEQRVSARSSVASPTDREAPQESFLAVDRPVTAGEVEEALRGAVARERGGAGPTIPATPLALNEEDPCRMSSHKPQPSED